MSPAAIERAAIFALLDPELAAWATTLAAGLRSTDFRDPFCRLCFKAIIMSKRREKTPPTERDILRRYSWCQKNTILQPDVEMVETFSSKDEDPTRHAPADIIERPVTQEELDSLPEFVREGVKPGDPIAETKPSTVHEVTRLRPVDHLIQTADFTRKAIEEAFDFLQSHKRSHK